MTNTPKPFNPVVPLPEPEVIQFQGTDGSWHGFLSDEHEANTISHGGWPLRNLYTLAQLREYAASVAREMVPAEKPRDKWDEDSTWNEVAGHNACRAGMLARIEAYVGEGK